MIAAFKKYPDYKSCDDNQNKSGASDRARATLSDTDKTENAANGTELVIPVDDIVKEKKRTAVAENADVSVITKLDSYSDYTQIKVEEKKSDVEYINFQAEEQSRASYGEVTLCGKISEQYKKAVIGATCTYDAKLVRKLAKTLDVKKKVGRAHGIKLLTPLAMEELKDTNKKTSVVGHISYKHRKPKDAPPISELRINGGRWNVISDEYDVSGYVRGYIPIGDDQYIAVYDTTDLFDKLFPIVFVVVLVWMLAAGYIQGREALMVSIQQ